MLLYALKNQNKPVRILIKFWNDTMQLLRQLRHKWRNVVIFFKLLQSVMPNTVLDQVLKIY
jgi:hypothetical protein